MKKIEIYYLFDDKKLKKQCAFPIAYIKMHELLTQNGYELAPGAGSAYWSTNSIDDMQAEVERVGKLFEKFSEENPWFEECNTKLDANVIENFVSLGDCFLKNGEFDEQKALKKLTGDED